MTDAVHYMELLLLLVGVLAFLTAVLWLPHLRRRRKVGELARGWRSLTALHAVTVALWGGFVVYLVALLVETDLASHWRAVFVCWRAASPPGPAECEVRAGQALTLSGWWLVLLDLTTWPLFAVAACWRRLQARPDLRLALLAVSASVVVGYVALLCLLSAFAPNILTGWVQAMNAAWGPYRHLFPGT